MSSRNRTAGAPSMPIKTEADLLWEEASRQYEAGEISKEQWLNVAKATGRWDQARAYYEGKADANRPRLEREAAVENAAIRASVAPPEPDMRSVDVLPGDTPGTERVWNPQTRTYDTRRKGGMGPRPQEPKRGMPQPWGGGRAFASQAEADAYNERRTLGREEREGLTPMEIRDAEASQRDRDMRNAGMGTHGGYAPVYVNGRAVPMQRAPNPEWSPTTNDVPTILQHGRDVMKEGIDAELTVPIGDDGLPVVNPGMLPRGRFDPGTANAATDNRSTGPRAANRDVAPSLRRPDLEARGYRPTLMDGPNGKEWVYAIPETLDPPPGAHGDFAPVGAAAGAPGGSAVSLAGAPGDPTDWSLSARRARAEAAKNDRILVRLRTQAGLAGKTDHAAYNDPSLLRELIAGQRAQRETDKEAMWRPRAMMQRGNAVGALKVPGLTDGQEAYLLGGPTPLAVDQANALRAAQIAQQAVTGFLANSPPSMTPAQQQMAEQKLRAANPAAAGAGDIAGRNYESPEAIAEFRRLAAQNDTAWFGTTFEDQDKLARVLQEPPYSMSQADAEEYAYRYMNKKSWLGARKPGEPGAESPPAPPPGRAWGWGGPRR